MRKFAVTALILTITVFAVSSVSAQEWVSYTTDNSGIPDNTVRTLVFDSQQTLWVGNGSGLGRLSGDTWTLYTTDDNVAGTSIRDLAFEITDHGPEIWVASDNGVSVIGVDIDAITVATPYRSDNTGLINNSVNAAEVTTDHVRWFGTDEGVSTFNGTDWVNYTIDELLSVNRVLSIAAAEDGWIFLGTDGGGVSRYDGVSTASPYDTEWSGIPSDTILSVYVEDSNHQWFGTDNGVGYHASIETKYEWTSYTTADGLADNTVYSITKDQNGAMWFGTANGLSKFDGTTWTNYTTADGLAGNTVYSLAVGANNSIWAGTIAGLSRLGEIPTAVDDTEELPAVITIDNVYPNPFNPTANISFSLPSDGTVAMHVYNVAGQKVATLHEGTMSAGHHSVVWNGTNANGLAASSGVYFVTLNMNGVTATQRMTLVR